MTKIKKPLTANERKAIQRKKKRAKGWIPLELWVHTTQKDKAKEMEIELQEPLNGSKIED